MSRNIETSIYSLDGNSIFDIALKFERLGLQEMSKNSEVIYQGQDLTDSNVKDATSFKIAFDKFFSLYKEFYIKVAKGTQVLDDAIQAELEEQFETDVIKEREEQSVKSSIRTYIEDTFKPLRGTIGENTATISNYLDNISKKINKITSFKNDSNLTKYAKLDMIDDALEYVEGYADGQITIPNYDGRKNKILDKLKEARQSRKILIINEYKQNTETKSKIDNNLSLRLATYEGTASNVLRDMLILSYNLVQDINTKGLNLQSTMINDGRLGNSIIDDYDKIVSYDEELVNSSEVKKNYNETYRKVIQNLIKIQPLIEEIKSGLGIE